MRTLLVWTLCLAEKFRPALACFSRRYTVRMKPTAYRSSSLRSFSVSSHVLDEPMSLPSGPIR